MDPTRTSLLMRVKDPHNAAAWGEFHELYAPLLYAYARARGINHADAEEIRAACFETLVRQLPTFEYERSRGGFKSWLRTLVQRRVADFHRARREPSADNSLLDQVADQSPPPDEQWERAWRQRHLQYCMEKAATAVSQDAYSAFRMLVDERKTVPEVCQHLGWSANQVYKAKSRVLTAIRAELALLDPEL